MTCYAGMHGQVTSQRDAMTDPSWTDNQVYKLGSKGHFGLHSPQLIQ